MAVLGLGRGAVPASLPVRSVSWCGPTRRLGGQVAPWPGGAQARRSSRVQACCQGQARGRCSTTRRAELGDPGGNHDEGAANGAGGRGGQLRAAQRCSGAGEVEREHRQHQPRGVGGERAAGQVCQGGVLQVGVDLFDDGVAAVGYVGCHGLQAAGGEEGVVSPQVEQSVLAVRIEFGDAADHLNRPGTCCAFDRAAKAT